MRRILLALVCTMLTLLAFSPADAAADDFTSARAAFGKRPPVNQFAVALQLAALGHYSGMAGRPFSKSLYGSIRAFQAELNEVQTGILSDQQVEALERRSKDFVQTNGFDAVDHPSVKMRLWIPLKQLPTIKRTERGWSYSRPDHTLAVDYLFYPDSVTSTKALYDNLSTVRADRQVGYHIFRDDFFVVAGESEGMNFYSRFQVTPSGNVGFILSWDDKKQPYGSRLAVLMSNMFWAPTDSPAAATASTPSHSPAPSTQSKTDSKYFSGTGFVVSSEGHVLTSNHVIDKCGKVLVVGLGFAEIRNQDKVNDLALLKVDAKTTSATFRAAGLSLGEKTYALGFPYAGTLADSLNITDGIVSALAGIGNDSRYVQFTAPVQPGNSGGPMVDERGLIVGVVTARLNEIAILKSSGSLPQNVNFALRVDLAASFLKASGIEPQIGVAPNLKSASEVATGGRAFTFQIICPQAAN